MGKPAQKEKISSADYILRCSDIIRADKNISDATIQIMFLEYGALLLSESSKTPANKV